MEIFCKRLRRLVSWFKLTKYSLIWSMHSLMACCNSFRHSMSERCYNWRPPVNYVFTIWAESIILQRSLLTLSIVLRVIDGFGFSQFGRDCPDILSIYILQLLIVSRVTVFAWPGKAKNGFLIREFFSKNEEMKDIKL